MERERADTGELWRRCSEMSSHKFGSEKEDHRHKQFVRQIFSFFFFFKSPGVSFVSYLSNILIFITEGYLFDPSHVQDKRYNYCKYTYF